MDTILLEGIQEYDKILIYLFTKTLNCSAHEKNGVLSAEEQKIQTFLSDITANTAYLRCLMRLA